MNVARLPSKYRNCISFSSSRARSTVSWVRKRSIVLVPVRMSFISTWAKAPPLPGWTVSRLRTTNSLPSSSRTTPGLISLAPIFMALRRSDEITQGTGGWRASYQFGGVEGSLAARPCHARRLRHERTPGLASGKPRAPPPVPRRPRAHHQRRQRLVRGGGVHRGRYAGAAGESLHGAASPGLRHDAGDAGGRARPALSPHLARIRHQEAAGGRDGAHLPARPRLPEPRAGGRPRAGIHDARMVPRGSAAGGIGGRLRGAAMARMHGGGDVDARLRRTRLRSHGAGRDP